MGFADDCGPSVPTFNMDSSEVANSIIINQHKRDDFLSKQVKMGFGTRSKTKYGSNVLKSVGSSVYNFPGMVYRRCNREVCKSKRDLVNALNQAYDNNANKETIMSFVDLGFRIEEPDLGYRGGRDNPVSTANVILNMILFAFICTLDWQYYLRTPFGFNMLNNLVNNRLHRIDFIKMLMHAAINGISPSDILSVIPQMGIVVCDGKWYQEVATWVARRTVYETATRIPLYLS